jgi:hypothetical protein
MIIYRNKYILKNGGCQGNLIFNSGRSGVLAARVAARAASWNLPNLIFQIGILNSYTLSGLAET